nr:MAG TPA: hypothetical protein [Caudoviricetes sp.]
MFYLQVNKFTAAVHFHSTPVNGKKARKKRLQCNRLVCILFLFHKAVNRIIYRLYSFMQLP